MKFRYIWLTAAALLFISCPTEIINKNTGTWAYSLAPLESLVEYESFDKLNIGVLEIDSIGSSLSRKNGVFRKTTTTPNDAVFTVVEYGSGHALKIENPGAAGGNFADFLYIPSADAFNAMAYKKVLLQYRVKLEQSSGAYLIGPQIHHTRYPDGGVPNEGTPSGYLSVDAQISGTGQFYVNGKNAAGANEWKAVNIGVNKWHAVEVLLDFGDCTYRIYVNGNIVTDELFRNTISPSFGTLRFCMNSANTTAYFDDIRITTDSVTGPFAVQSWHPDGVMPGYILADEDFEGFAVNYIFANNSTFPAVLSDFFVLVPVGGNIGIVKENDGNNVLQFSSAGSGTTALRYNTSSVISGSVGTKTIYLSFRMKYNNMGTVFIPYVYQNIYGAGSVSVSNRFSGGKYYYFDRSVHMPGIPAAENAWHDIGIIINYATKRYLIYFDGKLEADNLYFRMEENPVFGTVSFSIDSDSSGNNGSFWLDNIRMSYE